MQPNPDAPRGPSIRLTEDLLKKLGLTCIWLDGLGNTDSTKLVLRTIIGRRAKGEKVWFRSQKDAEKVQKACLSRCFEAKHVRDGVLVKLPYDQVIGLVELVANSLGIGAIKDCDVATTFDSIHYRIDTALARMQRDGSMKRINREYASLRAAGTSSGTIGTGGTNKLPSYQIWLVDRLGRELTKCTDLVHLMR